MSRAGARPYPTAVILAGGRGTRLGSWGRVLPKCLLPVFDKPLLLHQIEQCAAAGVSEILVSTSSLFAPTVSAVLSLYTPPPAVSINCVAEPQPLGPILAILSLAPRLRAEAALVVLGDEYYEDHSPFLSLARRDTVPDLLLGVVYNSARHRILCNAVVDADGGIVSLREKPAADELIGRTRWCGLAGFAAGVLDTVPTDAVNRYQHFGDLLSELMSRGLRAEALEFNEVHLNLNTADDALMASLVEAKRLCRDEGHPLIHAAETVRRELLPKPWPGSDRRRSRQVPEAAAGPVVRRQGRGTSRPRVLLVFPSTSTRAMAGSIGELTALVRLGRELGEGFRLTFAELVRNTDPHPRVDGLLRSLGGTALFETADGSAGLEVYERPLRRPPDAVVLASFRAFFQYPVFPGLIDPLLTAWRQAGSRIMALDPCGDSFVTPIPPDVAVLAPQPFTYGKSHCAGQFPFSGAGEVLPDRRRDRWLWAAAPWMRRRSRFRVAERLALFGLSTLGVEVSVLSALDPALPFLRQPLLIDDGLRYNELEETVARHEVLITANCRSVLAARAAAMGVPVALVDPANLPDPAGYDSTTDELLATAAAERLGPALVPLEFRTVRCGSPSETAASFRALQDDLESLRRQQHARCIEYEALPLAADCVMQILAS